MGRAFAVLLMCLFSVSAFAGSDDWERLLVANHPVSVKLPQNVGTEHHVSDWGIGKAETDIVSIEAFGGILSANATVTSTWAIKFAGHDLIHTTTRDTVLRQCKGKQTAVRKLERSGIPGRRYEYKLRRNGQDLVGIIEVYVFEQYIVTFKSELPPGAPAGTAEAFFSSIRLADFAKRS